MGQTGRRPGNGVDVRALGSRLFIAMLWLIRLLPYPAIVWLGHRVGDGARWLAVPRRRVARTNLRLCFPDRDEAWRSRVLRDHFRALGRSLVERGVWRWSTEARIRRLVRLEGHDGHADGPVIWLVPHFVGLDAIAMRLAAERFPVVSMYSRQKDAVVDRLLVDTRTRFGHASIHPRQAGLKPLFRALGQGVPIYYLPDMDLGTGGSRFVPFFGVPAATVAALPRLAARSGARVRPFVAVQEPWGYRGRFFPAWEDYPGGDGDADVRRMNAFIEARVLEHPEQYYWVHKRFKTRPGGEPSLYE